MSAEAVVLTAFGAHFLKKVPRSQLESAAKSLLPTEVICQLKKIRQISLSPCGSIFEKGIVKIADSANLRNLARDDIKSGTILSGTSCYIVVLYSYIHTYIYIYIYICYGIHIVAMLFHIRLL